MASNEEWVSSKAKERSSQNFIRTVLEYSGYKVMNFGIEEHDQKYVDLIKDNYHHETNRRLLSMPDLVVIDEKTKESSLVEVKYRTCSASFNQRTSTFIFGYGKMKQYIDYWKEATLVFAFNVKPYCLCVDIKDINWNVHFRQVIQNKSGKVYELWCFRGIYQILNNKFEKVKDDTIRNNLNLLGVMDSIGRKTTK